MGLFLLPFASSLLVLLTPRVVAKWLALLLSLLPLGLLFYGWTDWVLTSVDYNWLPALSIHFHLKVYAVSLLFLFLTAIVIPITVAVASNKRSFYALILLVEGLLFGFFLANDLFFFTLFFEAMLIPLYFVINLWGGADRLRASLTFIIYMIVGSALLIAAVLALYLATNTLNLDELGLKARIAPHAIWIFAIFLLAFAVKTPLFPFHAWLPDAYYEAPIAGTILLSGLLSKAGIYGLYRIGIGLFPEQLAAYSTPLLVLSIAGVLYGAFAAWQQNDFKRLIAYSSLSHVNFILVGFFAINSVAELGAILQAFNHGITITALFLVAWWLETRVGTTSMDKIGGLTAYMPRLSWLTLFFILSSIALPGLNNFVGELLIFYGLFGRDPYLTALLGTVVIFSVVYSLRFMQKIYYATPTAHKKAYVDIGMKEITLLLPLIFLILWIGIYPSPLLTNLMENAK